MYIKLIQPKMKKRPMDTELKTRMAPSLGLLTIANIVRGEHDVVIENENVSEIVYDDNPDIVGITVTVDVLPRAIEIAREFRRRNVVVVAGGIHITSAPESVPEDSFDVLCIGMAEGTWPSILKDYKNGCLKPIYRCEGKMRGEDIISPAYDMAATGEYLYCNIVHTSRGCPFRCDFCYNSSGGHCYIRRPIEDVLNDIKAVNSKHIMFIDDNFAGDPKWTMELVRQLKPLKIQWNAAVSANIADYPDLLDEMKESGCKGLFIGFESIHPDSIRSVHKVQNDTNKYDAVVEAIHSRGIMINASFVFGLDSDTKETFEYTLDWIVRHKIETVTSHILTPYPGTELYRQMEAEGRITTFDYSLYNTANVVFTPKNMTPEELYEGYIWIYKKIYSFKNIFKRVPRAKDQRAAYFLFNFLYRKFGSFTDFLCRIITYERIGRLGEKWARYLNSKNSEK